MKSESKANEALASSVKSAEYERQQWEKVFAVKTSATPISDALRGKPAKVGFFSKLFKVA